MTQEEGTPAPAPSSPAEQGGPTEPAANAQPNVEPDHNPDDDKTVVILEKDSPVRAKDTKTISPPRTIVRTSSMSTAGLQRETSNLAALKELQVVGEYNHSSGMAFVTPCTAKFIPLIDRFHESQREARLGKLSLNAAASGTSSSLDSPEGTMSPHPPTSATDHNSVISSPGGRGRGETVPTGPRSRGMKYSSSEHAVGSHALPREGSGSTISSVLSGSGTALGSPGTRGPHGVRGKGQPQFRRSQTVDSEDAVFSSANNHSRLRGATQGHSSGNLSKSSTGSDVHPHKGSSRATRHASRSISTSNPHSGHQATSSAQTSSLSRRAVPPPPVSTANRTIHDAVTARGVTKGAQAQRVSLAEQNVVVHDPRSPRSNKSTHSSVYGAVSGSGSSHAGSTTRAHQPQPLSPRAQNLEPRSTRASSDMSRIGGLSGASTRASIARRSLSHEVGLPVVRESEPSSPR